MNERGPLFAPGVLILDCSTACGSVALAAESGETYWVETFMAGRGHGGGLFQVLEKALQQAARTRDFEEARRREFADSVRAPAGRSASGSPGSAVDGSSAPVPLLAEVVVGLGPGSYSGVRQAIAAAQGLALATGARLNGFVSPLVLKTEAASYHAVGDARRGTFYYTAVEARRCVGGPELIESIETLRARLAMHPDWPVLAVEKVPAELPLETPVVWPLASRLPLSLPSTRCPPPLEPIYLRPVSVTLPKPAP